MKMDYEKSTENLIPDHTDSKEIYRRLNQGILQERLYTFESNARKNRDSIFQHGGLANIIHNFHNKHIIICAAGISLSNSIPLLKKIQNRDDIIILSVDMAYLTLIRNGIKPSFVITCETSPRLYFNGADSTQTTLLAFSCSNPSTIRSWKGTISFYNWMIHEEPYKSLWKITGEGLGFVATGSVVTTQALSLVLGLNPSSVTLTGNDLAFSDLPYASGSIWYDSAFAATNRVRSIETVSRNSVWNSRQFEIKRSDRTYLTNNQFLGAKYWIEDLLKSTNFKLFDMSLPGVSEKYVEKITPQKYERDVLGFVRKKRKRK
jgi:hypothetical protein